MLKQALLQRWFILLVMSFDSPLLHAIGYGVGFVSMNGRVVDAACTIAMDSPYQDIEVLLLEKQTLEKEFEIQLVNCNLAQYHKPKPNLHMLHMLFRNSESDLTKNDKDLIYIRRVQSPFSSSKLFFEQNFIPPSMLLKYRVHLIANSKLFQAGDYQSLIHFNLDYY
ncbi:hypothetical protein A6037_02975 [[Haemophilus] ducreyi]|uniref:fimbrial protein n=1 Tax=Haemophilus ducreyi TaxID=730 RepID=UPI0007CDA6CE|nr:hypothetical protein [[Haemophilus] ducreyi]ANF61780.1 hypothetical protein A6037_02975 [[Haemophilus] ducreyi]